MFNFISNYFYREKLDKNIVQPYIYSISKKSNFDELKQIFDNLLPHIPLDNYYSIDAYNELFSEFDYEQINTFSNNICLLIEQKMKEKLNQLNYCAELLLNFTVSIFVKCVNSITNEEFFFRQDIFQREVDKFDFSYRLMNIMFCIVHICDSNFEKSSQASIEFIDTIKLFLLNTKKDLFIDQEKQKKFLIKLYNTSIHNFETLVNNKINPIYDKKKFEKFIFFNIYLLWYILFDPNRNVLNDININETKAKNTFNIKTFSIIKKLLEIKDEKDINNKVKEYNDFFGIIIREELEKSNDKFMVFIHNFYLNISYLSEVAQNLIKIIILYVFEIYPDFCEMICLKKELIGKLLENIFPYNVFDLMILYRLSKSMNFYIAIKLAKITLEQMFLNCLINFLETKKNEKNKNTTFDFCLYYSLLTAKNFSKKLKYISELANNKLDEFNLYINNNTEINTENFYNNLNVLILYYEIDYGIMTSLDVPSKIILTKLKNLNSINKKISEYKEYYKNNLEYENTGKDIYQKFEKVGNKYLFFLNGIFDEIKKNGLDINLSNEDDVINLINRKSYKTNEDLIEDENIFNHNVEKFIISSIHGNDLYKIYNY